MPWLPNNKLESAAYLPKSANHLDTHSNCVRIVLFGLITKQGQNIKIYLSILVPWPPNNKLGSAAHLPKSQTHWQPIGWLPNNKLESAAYLPKSANHLDTHSNCVRIVLFGLITKQGQNIKIYLSILVPWPPNNKLGSAAYLPKSQTHWQPIGIVLRIVFGPQNITIQGWLPGWLPNNKLESAAYLPKSQTHWQPIGIVLRIVFGPQNITIQGWLPGWLPNNKLESAAYLPKSQTHLATHCNCLCQSDCLAPK